MDVLGRFSAIVMAIILLIFFPMNQNAEKDGNIVDEYEREYLYEINALVNRRGGFSKAEFEAYSYILQELRGNGKLELKTGKEKVGRKNGQSWDFEVYEELEYEADIIKKVYREDYVNVGEEVVIE